MLANLLKKIEIANIKKCNEYISKYGLILSLICLNNQNKKIERFGRFIK